MVKVKHGAITLPHELRQQWEGRELAVREASDERLILERLTPRRKRPNLDAWRRAAGILKHRRLPDPVVWQRKIRREWERRLG